MQQQGRHKLSAYNYGYTAGYNDRHYMRNRAAEQACDEEYNGYLRWLAGWRAGQAARRAEKPLVAMLYEPLWPVKPSGGKASRTNRKRVRNMTIWAVQTKMARNDARGQEYVVWELVPYFTELETRSSGENKRVLHYPMFPTRKAARVWKRKSCPGRQSNQMRIVPVSQIENDPELLVSLQKLLDLHRGWS